MALFEKMKQKETWEQFLLYKTENCRLSQKDLEDLERFVGEETYKKVIFDIEQGVSFPIPHKRQISKMHSAKKRTIYMYPRAENYVLKLLTYLLIRKYDSCFSDNLYSFRAKTGVKWAISFLSQTPDLQRKYVYKADIHDYFNSVDITQLLPVLQKLLTDEPEVFRFIHQLLSNPNVWYEGNIVKEKKGIMAGCPLASFLANVYLNDLDHHFSQKGILYARYSDDMIVFSDTREQQESVVKLIHERLQALELSVNKKKEVYTEPYEQWDFLGIAYHNGTIDISPVSKAKLKGKMRRKADALLRWKRKKGLDNTKAARAFVKGFNRKLYDNPIHSELTWSRWYFPIINTTVSLQEIDHYMQDCIRYIVTEKRTKRRYDFRYADMKSLGYQTLVHRYYEVKSTSYKNAEIQ